MESFITNWNQFIFSRKIAEILGILPGFLIFEEIRMLREGLRSLLFFVYNENVRNFIWIRSV